ncbi:MAG TPA: DNA polymerase Y family protein [Steroidobacteraceae bacterium]|nr:DNA polymerase Y family protein [Steroidobacteraceae bacterium]
MNRQGQHRLDLDLPPAQPTPVRAQVREVIQADALPAPENARELWVAVQTGEWRGEPEAKNETFPAALASLVKRAQAFTPRVTVESSDAVLMELAGSQRLFGGLPALRDALRAAFPRPLQLALAPTPLAAVLLARAQRSCCITTPARLVSRLAPISLWHLHWPQEELLRLAGMGVTTVGELLRLPRAGLARRIGPERLWQLDRLTGARSDPRALLAAPERFSERIDPDYETADRERLLAALAPTLTRLEEALRERQRGVMALRVVLHHRRAAPVSCVLRCVVPEYRAARFTALLAARLESLQLREPVRRMELTAGRPRRFVASSKVLWAPGEQGGDAAAAHAPEFLQTLMARLGEQAVHGLALVGEHRPERQYRSVWPAAATVPASMPEPVAVRPLGLMPEPLSLKLVCDETGRVRQLLHAGQNLELVSGPERIQSGWWDGADVTRDYYIARTADGAQWWVFRECDASRRWFVHGCFA